MAEKRLNILVIFRLFDPLHTLAKIKNQNSVI